MPTRVYIVEDHELMRETLIDYLSAYEDLEFCGASISGENAVQEIANADPSVVLLDLSLPGRSGLDVLSDLQANPKVPCIIISGHNDSDYVGSALALGARGYVLKGRPSEIPNAIRTVMQGEIYLSESLRGAAGRLRPLPTRGRNTGT